MQGTSRTYLLACLFTAAAIAQSVHAEGENSLPIWSADEKDFNALGKPFVDSRISVRPPLGLNRVDDAGAPEFQTAGVYRYIWTAEGTLPSTKAFIVVLMPKLAKPSKDPLDELILGLKNSLSKGMKGLKFGSVERGQFRRYEARYGTYTGEISGEKIDGYFLFGIDPVGTYSISAMLPHEEATPDLARSIRTAMLTFERAKTQDKLKSPASTQNSK